MLYRPIGTTGVEASVLGYGCMRLPVVGGKPDAIDYDAGTELLRHAIDRGVNYVDTAYFYHGKDFGSKGESEPFVGQALADGYRERVNLATKLPIFALKSRDDMPRLLAEQLERVRTDHLDFYLLHGLSGDSFDRVAALGALEFLEEARQEGLIRFPGFSFHGKVEDFKRIVDAYPWAMVQIQYNYVDTEYQAGYEGLRYAADKGIGVVVMEPLKGGKLADKAPEQLAEVFSAVDGDRTPADWALRYVWDEPGVSVVLSGMTTMEQLVENLAVAEKGVANTLTDADRAVYAEARKVMNERIKADCTACRYCMPCPQGVDIPEVLAAYNAAAVWDMPNPWMTGYTMVKGKAALCTACGQCEEVCPQGLAIPQLMDECKAMFGH
jgi:uncharacterized protein